MFVSLRSRLIAAFAFVIFLSLLLAGTAFVYLLRGYQTQVRIEHLAQLALPLALQARVLDRTGATPAQIDQFLSDQANQLGIRIILVDRSQVVRVDTGHTWIGKTVPPQPIRSTPDHPFVWGVYTDPSQHAFAYVALAPRLERGLPSEPRFYAVVLAVPQQTLGASWIELAPTLSVAALVALLVSVAVAFFLARSISKPIAQVTAASERMARGDFDQFIPVKGRDEVAQLASSFNTMAREVGQMHRTMRDLLANVSHELRTPLTSVQGFAQALVDGAVHQPEEYADAGRIIVEEALRMQRLVEDLLYLSKIESGQITMDKRPLDLAEVLRNSFRLIQPQADAAGVKLELDLNGKATTPMDGDSYRLEQVFVNLLDNAIKHTPRDGTITVKTIVPLASAPPHPSERSNGLPTPGTNGSRSRQEIAVAVHNSGSYIAPDDLPRVFERFYQADRSRQRNGRGGSGLGLAIVREVVQLHHGRVAVESTPTDGTTFTVYLPSKN